MKQGTAWPAYTGRQLEHVAFPLGGIGTGSVSLGGWGQLRDWEIMNQPAKGKQLWFTFFTLKLNRETEPPLIKVLQGPVGGNRIGNGTGASDNAFTGAQLPHFRSCAFHGTYPFARVMLQDELVPLDVSVEAFNPFIPLNDRDSSIPVAVLQYHLKNTGTAPISGTVGGNLGNPLGNQTGVQPPIQGVNQMRTGNGLTGLTLSADGLPPDDPQFGGMVLATPWATADVSPRWRFPHVRVVWELLTQAGPYPKEGKYDIGTVGAHFELAPGEAITIPFFITWYYPNYEFAFDMVDRPLVPGKPRSKWKNYYATVWSDAWDVAAYVTKHQSRLYEETKRFHDALFSSTLPAFVLDAVSSQISTLKTTTCLRLTDGTFYGFEGVSDTLGSCPGSCTHVWNYAQALPYLFPALQRSMREADYRYALRDDGMGQARLPLPLGAKADWIFHPAADGQMGGVMQVYREWLISGDDAWLRQMWPLTKKALEFAWKYWDADRDGVMEGMQHNTYDIEFHGPNPLTGGLYLGALRAAEEMARVVGEPDKAAEYRRLFERGSQWIDQHLFNGEYYEQQVNHQARDLVPDSELWKNKTLVAAATRDEFPWLDDQMKNGCLTDQLLGQWYARMLGLGDLFDATHIQQTLRSIFRYNWNPDFTNHAVSAGGAMRVLNEEAALVLCSSPRDNRPGVMQFCADDVWSGIEYAAAALMIYEGFINEGLQIVQAIRARYTGEHRNPWDELECGHHYARAMASYSLLLALSGFQYSAPAKRIGFAPRLTPDHFTTFFAVGSGWGVYRQQRAGTTLTATIRVDYGHLELAAVRLDARQKVTGCQATCGGKSLAVSWTSQTAGVELAFATPVRIRQGEVLALTL